jgi:hypothetical protein
MCRLTQLRIPLILAIVSAALLAAGCGGKASPGSASTNGGAVPRTIVSAAYKYSSCMRKNGVESFPDPTVVNQPGQHGLTIHLSPGVAGSPSFDAARKACGHILPSPANGNGGESPQQLAAHLKGVVAFASCMRSHGFSTFPDPTTQGQLTPEMLSAAGINLHAPAVQSVGKACVPASEGQITDADVEAATAG